MRGSLRERRAQRARRARRRLRKQLAERDRLRGRALSADRRRPAAGPARRTDRARRRARRGRRRRRARRSGPPAGASSGVGDPRPSRHSARWPGTLRGTRFAGLADRPRDAERASDGASGRLRARAAAALRLVKGTLLEQLERRPATGSAASCCTARASERSGDGRASRPPTFEDGVVAGLKRTQVPLVGVEESSTRPLADPVVQGPRALERRQRRRARPGKAAIVFVLAGASGAFGTDGDRRPPACPRTPPPRRRSGGGAGRPRPAPALPSRGAGAPARRVVPGRRPHRSCRPALADRAGLTCARTTAAARCRFPPASSWSRGGARARPARAARGAGRRRRRAPPELRRRRLRARRRACSGWSTIVLRPAPSRGWRGHGARGAARRLLDRGAEGGRARSGSRCTCSSGRGYGDRRVPARGRACCCWRPTSSTCSTCGPGRSVKAFVLLGAALTRRRVGPRPALGARPVRRAGARRSASGTARARDAGRHRLERHRRPRRAVARARAGHDRAGRRRARCCWRSPPTANSARFRSSSSGRRGFAI